MFDDTISNIESLESSFITNQPSPLKVKFKWRTSFNYDLILGYYSRKLYKRTFKFIIIESKNLLQIIKQ